MLSDFAFSVILMKLFVWCSLFGTQFQNVLWCEITTEDAFTSFANEKKPGDNGPYASLAAMFSNRVRHFDCVINRGC